MHLLCLSDEAKPRSEHAVALCVSLLHGPVTPSGLRVASLLGQQEEKVRVSVRPAQWRLLSYSHSLDTIACRSWVT